MTHRAMNAMLLSVLLLGATTALTAQKTTQIHAGRGGSPHVRTEWTIGGANVAVEYGRPYLKGRTIGKQVVPYGQVWRVGADESTTLTTDTPLRFGNLTVPAGKVTLWVMPAASTGSPQASEQEWQLIINKETGQWGTDYKGQSDMGRVEMKVEKTTTSVEQLTISIDPNPAGGGTLRVEWGTVRASIPFTVMK